MSSLNSQSHLLSVGGLRGGNPAPPGGSIPYGQQTYTSPGTYTWVAPEQAGWTNVSAVMIAQGSQNNTGTGGAAGGSLTYGNNIPVLTGHSYTIIIGTTSYMYPSTNPTNNILLAYPGPSGSQGNDRSGGGGGGSGGPYSNAWFVDGGGGAGGYSGNGGRGGGGSPNPGWPTGHGVPGSGGGGGGGGGAPAPSSTPQRGGNGGNVGLHGQGPNGGGGNGANSPGGNGSPGPTGVFGGGAGSSRISTYQGTGGGCRILWGGPPAPTGGTNRIFPTTNVG